MKKKVIGLLLAVCLTVGLMPAWGIVQAETQTESDETQCQPMYQGYNINAQNYGNDHPFWSSPIKSYLVPMSDGGVMRVQAGGKINGILVEYYDASHKIQPSRTKLIAEELSIFGGFYATSDAYYVLTGQENPQENAEVEVYRITKYDAEWNRLDSDGLKDCNTTVPFDAGCVRMEAYGDYLLIRTSHKMYESSDGFNHQSNVTIQFDMNNVKITDSYTNIMNSSYGYVSHSFNQFLHIENGNIVAVDHGDANPRSIALIKYPTDVTTGKFTSDGCSVIDVMRFSGEAGANDTRASVGAFEISGSSYLVAGNSGEKDGVTGETHNVFVAAVDKGTNAVIINWLTNYAQGDGTTSTPHMVKLSDDHFVVLWSREGQVCYTEVNGKGQVSSDIYSMKGELSDCAPVVANDNITWYTWNNETITFYDIKTSDLPSNSETIVETGHRYEVVKMENGIADLRCSACGDKNQVAIYTSCDVYWKEDSNSSEYSTYFAGQYNKGDVLYFWVEGQKYSSDKELNAEWTIKISDEDKVRSTITSQTDEVMGYFTMVSPGEVTIEIGPKYNPDITETFNLTIAFDPVSDIELTPATLTLKEGETGELQTTVKPDTADQRMTYSSSNTEVATVDEKGVVKAVKAGTATITAAAADGSRSAECKVTIEHVFDTAWHYDDTNHWYECIANGCTEDSTRGSEAAHSIKEVVDKAATETQEGLMHKECTECGYKSDAITIPKLEHIHSMERYDEVAATCENAGEKAHYRCTKCGKFYNDEAGNREIQDPAIPALGHGFTNYKIDEGSASCTKDGTETAKCDRCDVTDTRTVEGTMLPHQMSDWEITVAPTCTTEGIKTKKCKNCNYEESEKIAALGHTWKEVTVTPATEEQEGLMREECAVCGTQGKETVLPKLAHTHVMPLEYHEEIAPACTTAGKKAYYECGKCHKLYSETTGNKEISDFAIPALGHSFTNYKFDEGSASCTKDGTETAKCNRCDVTDTRTVEGTMLPHQMSDWITENPTCTKDGSRSRGCKNCDYTENQTIDALGHIWKEWAIIKEPTCTDEGSESRTCAVCNEAETRVVEAIGHKWSVVMEWAEDYSSAEATATCGNDPAHVETVKNVAITVKGTATCVEAGVITYTGIVTLTDGSVFADTKSENGEALGHSFTRYILNSDGSETAECDRCDETDTRRSKIVIKDKTGNDVKADIDGLDLKNIVENLNQHDVEVILLQEEAKEENVAALEEKVDKKYESVGTFEIRLLLSVDGGESTEITDGFGSIHLSLSAGKTYTGRKAIVYQLHGKEFMVYEGLTVDAEGNVTFEVDELSTFMVAVEKEQAGQISSGNKEPDKETTPAGTDTKLPATGDNMNFIQWVFICMAVAFVCAFLVGIRRRRRE